MRFFNIDSEIQCTRHDDEFVFWGTISSTDSRGAAVIATRSILNQFKDVNIDFNTACYGEDIRLALPHIKSAMDKITLLYIKQQEEELSLEYQTVMDSADREKRDFYEFFLGPWNPLEAYKSVIEGRADRRAGCSFYPADLTQKEFEDHIGSLPASSKELFTDHYSVIRRENGVLQAYPYHTYYATELADIAVDLKKAAKTIKIEELKNYLLHRADTLVNGNYNESDSEWVRMKNSPLELIIGPYEVYADGLLGIKATYEAMLMVVDHKKGAALKELENNLDQLAKIFPVPAGSTSAVGKIAPIVVVNQIYAGGEARQGIMASAFNLPNDPWVRGNVGWKQVMIQNIMRAKFENCTMKIAEKVLADGSKAEFDPYFNFVLLHEISHGLGPVYRSNGEPVAKSIGKAYTAIEEAKADTGALYLLLHLGGRFQIPAYNKKTLLDSYLAGLFRSMRFGVHEAHGAANVIQFNWFKEKGIISQVGPHTFKSHIDHLETATDELLNKLCEIEASASQSEAEAFIVQYGQPGDDIAQTIEALAKIPVDIKVRFPL